MTVRELRAFLENYGPDVEVMIQQDMVFEPVEDVRMVPVVQDGGRVLRLPGARAETVRHIVEAGALMRCLCAYHAPRLNKWLDRIILLQLMAAVGFAVSVWFW